MEKMQGQSMAGTVEFPCLLLGAPSSQHMMYSPAQKFFELHCLGFLKRFHYFIT